MDDRETFLRRHYPHQVEGYNLSLSKRPSTPNGETLSVFRLQSYTFERYKSQNEALKIVKHYYISKERSNFAVF